MVAGAVAAYRVLKSNPPDTAEMLCCLTAVYRQAGWYPPAWRD
ncbi:hypothetical protein ACIBK9_17250 [Nonomuraea sp. NPDC050227]